MGGRTLSVAHQATGRKAKSLLMTITTKRGPGSVGSTVLGSLALPVDGQQLPLSNNLQKQKARRKKRIPKLSRAIHTSEVFVGHLRSKLPTSVLHKSPRKRFQRPAVRPAPHLCNGHCTEVWARH